jgi:hypothetical protein
MEKRSLDPAWFIWKKTSESSKRRRRYTASQSSIDSRMFARVSDRPEQKASQ